MDSSRLWWFREYICETGFDRNTPHVFRSDIHSDPGAIRYIGMRRQSSPHIWVMLVESRFSKKSSFDLMIELAWDRIHEAKFSVEISLHKS